MTLTTVLRAPAKRSPHRAFRYLPATALVVDVSILIAAGAVAMIGRRDLAVFDQPADVSRWLTIVGPLILLAWIATIATLGGYREDAFGAGTDEYKRVLNASLVTASLLGVVCFLLHLDFSRGFFMLLFGVGIPALLVGRSLLRRAIHRARRQGHLQHRVLIAGTASHVDEIAAVLRREQWLGYHVDGALVPRSELRGQTRSGIPIVGTCDQVSNVVRHSDADVIFFAGGALSSAAQMRRIAWDLEEADVQMIVAPSVTDVSGERIRVRPVGGLPLMHIDPPRSTDASHWAKRIFDAVGSAMLLVALSPIFVFAAVRIKAHDGGPIFFRQVRIGLNGAHFHCLKFRTMVTDAEDRLADLIATSQASGLFKLKDDPRITGPGRWLRRYSLDELPQLLNVLHGTMSLIGPRPPLPREVEAYDQDVRRRLRVRPGMTGLWQVSGRSDLSWDEAVRLDLYYVDNWSMLQDLSILTKTVRAVLGSRGAY